MRIEAGGIAVEGKGEWPSVARGTGGTMMLQFGLQSNKAVGA